MPNMCGPEAVKVIREMGFLGPIFGVTGKDLGSDSRTHALLLMTMNPTSLSLCPQLSFYLSIFFPFFNPSLTPSLPSSHTPSAPFSLPHYPPSTLTPHPTLPSSHTSSTSPHHPLTPLFTLHTTHTHTHTHTHTGNMLARDVEEFIAHGADVILGKPLKISILCSAIKEHFKDSVTSN